jgi:PKD repeat protein
VKTNAPDNPEQVINVTLDVAGTKSLSAAPSSLDFNDVPVGQYAKMELLLTNTGNHPTTINSINITDSTFTHNGLLPLTVAPWSSTALVVTFAPTALGSKNATMTISSDANDHPSIQISLAGNGAPVPVVADFSADPTSGLPPLDVAFTDLSEGIVTSWSWNFGDSHTSTAQNPSHTYDANTAGAYSVSLAVSGPYGSDSTTKTNYIIINEGQWTTYTESSTGGGLPHNYIRDFLFNEDNSVWVATNGGGITKFKAGSWTKYTTANSGIANNAVWDLEYDGSGNLWIATNGGVSKFNGSSFTKYTSANSGLSDNNTRTVAVGSNGSTMWFGTVGGGACKFNGTSWTAYKTTNSPIPHNTVNAVDVDSAGNKWFGTLGGAAKFTDSSWTVYTTQLPSISVYDVLVDASDNVWFATTAGVSKFNGTSWTTYEQENGMPNENTRCINFDPNGIMWVGTNADGACRYNGTNWRQYTTSNSGLANNAVWAVGIEHQRRIWLGTNGGVNVYDISGNIIMDDKNKNKPKK